GRGLDPDCVKTFFDGARGLIGGKDAASRRYHCLRHLVELDQIHVKLLRNLCGSDFDSAVSGWIGKAPLPAVIASIPRLQAAAAPPAIRERRLPLLRHR